jgi:predicted permease
MSLTLTALYQIGIMFILILVGILCFKLKLIDQEINKKLSDMVLMLVNPLVIFVTYQRQFEAELLKGLLISIGLALATHFFSIGIGAMIFKKGKGKSGTAIERFALVYSNCGFIGIPLVNGLFGSEGVFYLTAYMTVFNLLVWTHGVILMTGRTDRKSIRHALLSPSVIATITGFLFFMFKIMLPQILIDSLTYIGNMNTPLAMMVAGITIAQTDIKQLLGKLRIYYISFLKLLFVPVVMLLLFQFLPLPRVLILTSVLAAACPTAATINLFSIRYDKDYLYASEIFAVTTILSMLTIPLVMMIGNFIA